MLPVLTLSIVGVVVSALVVAVGMAYLLNWPTGPALVFGVLIAATDPVAVIAMFKDTGIKGRLRLLVESESLFNDGVAAVLFGLALAWAQASGGSTAGPVSIAITLGLTSGGGIAVGLAFGAAVIALAGRTTDRLAETALTAVAAYGLFLLAEHFHFSGVLATVAAGLLMGNFALRGDPKQHLISGEGREFVVAFWEFAAFIANSFVFLMIGVTVAGIPFAGLGIMALSIAIGLVLFGRLLTVYPLVPALFAFEMGDPAARTVCPLVGRAARRARVGFGSRAPAVLDVSQRNPDCRIRRCRLLRFRPRADDEAASLSAWTARVEGSLSDFQPNVRATLTLFAPSLSLKLAQAGQVAQLDDARGNAADQAFTLQP